MINFINILINLIFFSENNYKRYSRIQLETSVTLCINKIPAKESSIVCNVPERTIHHHKKQIMGPRSKLFREILRENDGNRMSIDFERMPIAGEQQNENINPKKRRKSADEAFDANNTSKRSKHRLTLNSLPDLCGVAVNNTDSTNSYKKNPIILHENHQINWSPTHFEAGFKKQDIEDSKSRTLKYLNLIRSNNEFFSGIVKTETLHADVISEQPNNYLNLQANCGNLKCECLSSPTKLSKEEEMIEPLDLTTKQNKSSLVEYCYKFKSIVKPKKSWSKEYLSKFKPSVKPKKFWSEKNIKFIPKGLTTRLWLEEYFNNF